MTERDLHELITCFRRDMFLASGLRWFLLGVLFVCVFGAGMFDAPAVQRVTLLVMSGAILGWVLLAWKSLKQARQASIGAALVAMGRLDDAEHNLLAVLKGFGIFRNVKLIACHHLAAVLHARHEYRQVSEICRELLRHRFGSLRSISTRCRLMWADCLLMLDDLSGAYEAFRPVYQVSLSLQDRLKLLPIQTRYELAAGLEAQSVQSLQDKVRLAELMESQSAGLVHALLAEACRRRGMRPQAKYLAQRAWLYTDLDSLVRRCPLIEPVMCEADQARFGRGEP